MIGELITPQRPGAAWRSRGAGADPDPGRRLRAIASWAVFVLVCVAVWIVAGPSQLGGSAAYVIVDGRSMEPTYRDGDLVIVRAQESYEVGEIVAYEPDIGQPFRVIHRVVAVTDEGQYITQGDNREQPDGWLATDANIFGASWLHIPYGGKSILLLRQPLPWLGLAAGLFTLGLLSRPDQAGNSAQEGDHR